MLYVCYCFWFSCLVFVCYGWLLVGLFWLVVLCVCVSLVIGWLVLPGFGLLWLCGFVWLGSGVDYVVRFVWFVVCWLELCWCLILGSLLILVLAC